MATSKRGLAVLWLAIVLAMGFAGQRWLALGTRIHLEEEVREEVGEEMAGYTLRDSIAWNEDARRREDRIASMKRQRTVMRVILLSLPIIGVIATVWMLRRSRRT